MTETTTTTNTTDTPIVGPGNIVHTEFWSNDTEATRTFFTNTFGLQFTDYSNPEMEYFTFGDANLGIGGAVAPVPENLPGPVTTPYFSVTNLDETITTVTENGGNVVVPKTPVPGMGWFAWFTIPGGLTIAAVQYDASVQPPDN